LNINKIISDNHYVLQLDNVPLGFHDVTVRLINKGPEDTIVDENGNIVEDLYATIESIEIDGLNFKNNIDTISRYKDNDNNDISTFGWLSFNQDYSLILLTPGWYFLRNISYLPKSDVRNWLEQSLNS